MSIGPFHGHLPHMNIPRFGPHRHDHDQRGQRPSGDTRGETEGAGQSGSTEGHHGHVNLSSRGFVEAHSNPFRHEGEGDGADHPSLASQSGEDYASALTECSDDQLQEEANRLDTALARINHRQAHDPRYRHRGPGHRAGDLQKEHLEGQLALLESEMVTRTAAAAQAAVTPAPTSVGGAGDPVAETIVPDTADQPLTASAPTDTLESDTIGGEPAATPDAGKLHHNHHGFGHRGGRFGRHFV
ncbi:MAG: hypothetical protein AAF565_06580 [Pseudomonadota bacterium]